MKDLLRKFGHIIQRYCRLTLQQCGDKPEIKEKAISGGSSLLGGDSSSGGGSSSACAGVGTDALDSLPGMPAPPLLIDLARSSETDAEFATFELPPIHLVHSLPNRPTELKAGRARARDADIAHGTEPFEKLCYLVSALLLLRRSRARRHRRKAPDLQRCSSTHFL